MSTEVNKEIVSIIIPVYNVESFLEECLDSVCSQTYTALDIVCVNDGSTDSSLYILNKYEKRDSRIKVVSKDNGGLSSARNAGLQLCKGEYILFVDSDDILVPNAVEIMMSELNNTKSDVLVFGAELFPKENIENSGLVSLLSPEKQTYQGAEITETMIFDVGCCNIFVWNKLFKRSALCDIIFDEDILLGEDRCYLFDVFPKVQKVSIINDKLYLYRQKVLSSLTGTYRNRQLERTEWKIRIIEHILKRWFTQYPNITPRAQQHLIEWSRKYIERSIEGLEIIEAQRISNKLDDIISLYTQA